MFLERYPLISCATLVVSIGFHPYDEDIVYLQFSKHIIVLYIGEKMLEMNLEIPLDSLRHAYISIYACIVADTNCKSSRMSTAAPGS